MTDEATKLAMKYFSSDYNCAQSVTKSILESKGIDFDEVFHLTAGFGGGIGLQGHVCGAVSGAVAALGVINGKKYGDAKKHKAMTYESAQEFIRRFKEKNGSIICDKLTEIEMADKVQHDRALKDGTFQKICPGFVKDAVKIVLDLSGE
jgi:C_GCAxxG_C_C family probable redox protein